MPFRHRSTHSARESAYLYLFELYNLCRNWRTRFYCLFPPSVPRKQAGLSSVTTRPTHMRVRADGTTSTSIYPAPSSWRKITLHGAPGSAHGLGEIRHRDGQARSSRLSAVGLRGDDARAAPRAVAQAHIAIQSRRRVREYSRRRRVGQGPGFRLGRIAQRFCKILASGLLHDVQLARSAGWSRVSLRPFAIDALRERRARLLNQVAVRRSMASWFSPVLWRKPAKLRPHKTRRKKVLASAVGICESGIVTSLPLADPVL